MSNKNKIALLSKYQMKVLYYKCKEGATHAEIAELLGRDVNTVQYHMTKIYKILEIKKSGKSKEEMESELKNEICPIIREMFSSYDEVKIWAPVIKDRLQEEKENPSKDVDEPPLEESQPPYKPPPSVEKILNSTKNQPINPEIIESPPPGRRRINWRLIIGFLVFGLLIIIFLKNSPSIFVMIAEPTNTPMQPIPTPTAPPPSPTEISINILVPLPSPTFIPQEIIDPKDGMVLIHIPAREFEMGSSRAEDPHAFEEELPQHIVYLDAYWIDKTEVSNAQYALCVAESGACTKPANNYSLNRASYYDNDQYVDYPVIFVSWSQAAAYCAWAGRRLPTEAEWENAARGPEPRIYPWGNAYDGTLANYCDVNCQTDWKDSRFDDGYIDTSPVGKYPNGASMYGVLDMAGNVYEWVADWYGPYSQDRQTNPTGPASGLEKIIRGGSWGDDPAHVRSSVRSPINADNWLNFVGFRCAR
jgi:formylglycine-generating enzyme required for sulfatase activity/DNA-binding CsgD family transcriptional regulator